jgi:hypothetical protein
MAVGGRCEVVHDLTELATSRPRARREHKRGSNCTVVEFGAGTIPRPVNVLPCGSSHRLQPAAPVQL